MKIFPVAWLAIIFLAQPAFHIVFIIHSFLDEVKGAIVWWLLIQVEVPQPGCHLRYVPLLKTLTTTCFPSSSKRCSVSNRLSI